MAGLRLETDKKYCMRCVRAVYKNKSFFSKKFNKTLHVHCISMQDEEGDGAKYEMESQLDAEFQNAFVPGEMSCFYVSYKGPSLDEIQPLKPGEIIQTSTPPVYVAPGQNLFGADLVAPAYEVAAVYNSSSQGTFEGLISTANEILDAMIESRKRILKNNQEQQQPF